MPGDLGAGAGGGTVEADARAARRAVGDDLAGVRPEPVRGVLGGDAALERRAVHPDRLLGDPDLGERLSGRDAHLGLHEVDVGDLLGHRVLDLDPRVHLDEHVLAGSLAHRVDEELHGAGVDVPDAPGERDGVAAQGVADRGVQVGRGRDLDDLLVPALYGAVALVQVHDLPRGVRQDLDLDVPRPQDGPLEEDRGVTERAVRLAHRCGEGLREARGVLDPAHAPPAASGDGLDEEREADRLRGRHQLVDVGGRRRRRQDRDPGGAGGLQGAHLVARELEHVRGRSDERDPGLVAGARQVGVLREEAVPRVDRVRAGLARDPDDLRDVEIGPHGVARLPDRVRLVGLEAVLGVAVLVREDRDGACAELEGGTEASDGDLCTVGDEHLGEHAAHLLWAGRVAER